MTQGCLVNSLSHVSTAYRGDNSPYARHTPVAGLYPLSSICLCLVCVVLSLSLSLCFRYLLRHFFPTRIYHLRTLNLHLCVCEPSAAPPYCVNVTSHVLFNQALCYVAASPLPAAFGSLSYNCRVSTYVRIWINVCTYMGWVPLCMVLEKPGDTSSSEYSVV